MLFFIPWVVLIAAVIIAVPVAAKLSPSPTYAGSTADAEGIDAEAAEEGAVVVDDFAAEEVAEPLADDAFEEFN